MSVPRNVCFTFACCIIVMITLFDSSGAETCVPVINEVMSNNIFSIEDEDGDNSDWIEIYNPGSDSIDLSGYTLSDNINNLTKWSFAESIIGSHEHLLVFASGKDRAINPKHWETVIKQGDIWHYFVGSKTLPDKWYDLQFDDSGWLSGPSGLGYGDNDDATIVPSTLTLFIRKSFDLPMPTHIISGFLHIDYNDGFVAYLNGHEIARFNVAGSIDEHPPYNQHSIYSKNPLMIRNLPPEGYRINDIQSLLVTGKNVLAIQVHNNNATSENLSVIPFLTIGMDTVPDTPGTIDDVLQFVPPKQHTNFKLSDSGEILTLCDKSGLICDKFSYNDIPIDYSEGRSPDGGSEVVVFTDPTPGETNDSPGYTVFSDTAVVGPACGFYENSVIVTMSVNSPTAEIRYTLNSNDPDATSSIYSNPISITKTTVVKTRVYEKGMLPSGVTTSTYFVNVKHTLPVISISTPGKNLWNSEIGIYYSPNYWNDWERPAHIEFYEADGTLEFSEDAGVSIQGGLGSRYWPQKSLAITFRERYGIEKISFRLFPDSSIEEYNSFVLRNAGNDFDKTHFRDAMIQQLVKDCDIDYQNYRPAVVYLNGSYWGIQNIRDKLNEDYLATHHGVDPDDVDILELNAKVVEGNAEKYLSVYNFIESNDMSSTDNYNYVQGWIDIDEFIIYNIIEIYCDNQDWPGNNTKYWCPRNTKGKWRWLLFDTDIGFGAKSSTAFENNTLEYATAEDGVSWKNPSWSTMIFRKLLENEDFKKDFINRFMDYFSTCFTPETVTNVISTIQEELNPEMSAHIERWGYPASMSEWENNIDVLKTFAQKRPEYLINYIREMFDTGDQASIMLNVSDNVMGSIKINSITVKDFPWNGTYFTGIPVTISAVPNPGFRFVRWEGDIESNDIIQYISNHKNVSLRAVFEESNPSDVDIVINEICCASPSEFDAGDWIELYNNGTDSVDLSNWILKDSKDGHIFIIEEGSSIAPEGFMILCTDSIKFKQIYPTIVNVQGNFEFGLDQKGDAVRLYNNFVVLVDSLTYDNQFPWPELSVQEAQTLSLSNPNLDNTLAGSWKASKCKGTPGAINDNYAEIDENTGELIVEFSLGQNYPNPFNAVTTIPFDLPRESDVKIEVYSILGQKVATLTNTHYPGGRHIITLNGKEISSGIYFYTMSADRYFKTNRMLLLK